MDISNITVNAHSSILINAGKKIYFDPFEIEAETHDADFIFITHDHYDHYSVKDINKIIAKKTVFIIPAPMEKKVGKDYADNKIVSVIPGQKYETADFSFETVPAYNIAKPFHSKRAGWCGYVVNIENVKTYVAGDIDAINEAKELKCDIALIPIGGTYTMNYKEAAKLINVMQPKAAIPTHYGSIIGSSSDGAKFKELVDEGIKVEIKL